MEFSSRQSDPRRHLVGFAFVVLFHGLIVYALVSGLAKKVVDVVRAPIETKVIEEIKKPPPPPPEVVLPPPPRLEAPPPPFIPPPEVQIATPPPVPTITAIAPEPPPAPVVIAPTPPPAPAPVAVTAPSAAPPPLAPTAPPPPKPVTQSIGAVCTKLVTPELPAVDVSIKADITVSYTIQGGKVTKVTVVKETYNPGNVDRKVKRAFIAAIKAAAEQYECAGDFVDVPQQFAFTIN